MTTMCVHVHIYTRAHERTSLLHDIVHRASNSCQRTGRIAQNQFNVFKLSILWITLLKRGWQQGEVLGSQGNTIATCYTCTDAIVIIFQLHCISIHMYRCRQVALLRPVSEKYIRHNAIRGCGYCQHSGILFASPTPPPGPHSHHKQTLGHHSEPAWPPGERPQFLNNMCI